MRIGLHWAENGVIEGSWCVYTLSHNTWVLNLSTSVLERGVRPPPVRGQCRMDSLRAFSSLVRGRDLDNVLTGRRTIDDPYHEPHR